MLLAIVQRPLAEVHKVAACHPVGGAKLSASEKNIRKPLPFFPAGVGRAGGAGGAAGVRDVCGPESNVRVFALRLFHNIEG